MTQLLTFILFLVGAAGEGDGVAFQAQVGYEPALLYKGKDFNGQGEAGGLPDFSTVLYFSQTFSGKAGILAESGWSVKATGSLTNSRVTNSGTSFYLPSDSAPLWFSGSRRSIELGTGVEIGYSFEPQYPSCLFLSKKDSTRNVYVGLEGVWGKLSGNDAALYENQDDPVTFHVTSKVVGIQGYAGLGVPVCSFGKFDLQLHTLLKGGAVKEYYIEILDMPTEAQIKDPRTLLKWGIALGLTVNYDREKL